jgi:hypothetical protein
LEPGKTVGNKGHFYDFLSVGLFFLPNVLRGSLVVEITLKTSLALLEIHLGHGEQVETSQAIRSRLRRLLST